MKRSNALFLPATAALALWLTVPAFAATEVTVNSTNTDDTANSELTLTEAVLWMNNPGYRVLSAAESNQVATIAGTTNLINFAITGTGPFVITDIPTLEITASNVVVNGYSQSGSSPNTNPILAANNAVLKIVLKSTTGARAFTIHGDDVWVRGLCLENTRIAFDGEEYPNPGDFYVICKGGGVQGCWIGVEPDGTTVAGGMNYGVATWYTLGGHVIGTDGDGVNDRNEFNVIVAAEEEHIAVSSPNCRVSGNFINVMPNGLTSSGYATTALDADGIYLEEIADNCIIGTDSNGVSDEDERNIIGGLNGKDANCEVIGSWAGATTNVTVMGNYIGVGIDGTTALPNKRGIAVDNPGLKMLVGSNEDGVRDELEANIIANISIVQVFKFNGSATQIVFRRNSFFGNTADFFNSGDNINSYNGAVLLSSDTATISPVVSNTTTRAVLIGYVPVSGDPTANNRTNAAIQIYQADPTAEADRPQGKKWLATYLDNGPEDLDSRTNYFQFNICNLPISSTGAKITVNETCGDDLGGGSSRFATALALPDVSNSLSISNGGTSVTVFWQMNGVLQTNASLTSGTWGNAPGCSPKTFTVGPGPLYFRVKQ
jgi:hypothetical protein